MEEPPGESVLNDRRVRRGAAVRRIEDRLEEQIQEHVAPLGVDVRCVAKQLRGHWDEGGPQGAGEVDDGGGGDPKDVAEGRETRPPREKVKGGRGNAGRRGRALGVHWALAADAEVLLDARDGAHVTAAARATLEGGQPPSELTPLRWRQQGVPGVDLRVANQPLVGRVIFIKRDSVVTKRTHGGPRNSGLV